MCEPVYQELRKKQIPTASKDGVHVAVIAGESLDKKVFIRFYYFMKAVKDLDRYRKLFARTEINMYICYLKLLSNKSNIRTILVLSG